MRLSIDYDVAILRVGLRRRSRFGGAVVISWQRCHSSSRLPLLEAAAARGNAFKIDVGPGTHQRAV